ncbi:hypothetical protein V5799_020934 [Amblyomma americanum]|uniref:Uncharacterized protein n=1 Tax=Amblyomma americanum TaxID=6943 RepID=A0AAQ4ESI6_AMBAM
MELCNHECIHQRQAHWQYQLITSLHRPHSHATEQSVLDLPPRTCLFLTWYPGCLEILRNLSAKPAPPFIWRAQDTRISQG